MRWVIEGTCFCAARAVHQRSPSFFMSIGAAIETIPRTGAGANAAE